MIDDAYTAPPQSLAYASRPCPADPGALESRREPRSTERALRWARAGDRQALRFLYVRYADDVYACVRPIVGDDREAEHVVRRVFAEMHDSIAHEKVRDLPFYAWILSVSRTLALDHVRRRPQPRLRPAPASRIVAA